MTPARVIDTQRLSTLAHEYEREIVHFLRDLMGDSGSSTQPSMHLDRIRRQVEKGPFMETRLESGGELLTRLGSGKYTVVLHAQSGAARANAITAAVYAGILIHELGMYDDFTLWVSISQAPASFVALKRMGIHADCALLAEPTNLCIQMRQGTIEGPLRDSHPLVQAAIATYETLFELPPVVCPATAEGAPAGIPAIAFGASEDAGLLAKAERVAQCHLLKATQFYAAFPVSYVDSRKPR